MADLTYQRLKEKFAESKQTDNGQEDSLIAFAQAVAETERPSETYRDFSTRFFLGQLYGRLLELEQAYRTEDWETVRNKCAEAVRYLQEVYERSGFD